MSAVITFTIFRWLRHFWRKLMVYLRLKPANYANSADVWSDVTNCKILKKRLNFDIQKKQKDEKYFYYLEAELPSLLPLGSIVKIYCVYPTNFWPKNHVSNEIYASIPK